MIDQQGKVFGRVNIIDLSFFIVLVGVLAGLLWVYMGQSPLDKKILARGQAEVTVAIRGARIMDPSILKEHEKVFLTIRNQRYEPVEVTSIKQWQRQVVFLGKDNKPVVFPDPTAPEVRDIDLKFVHAAEKTAEGYDMDGHHLKVGNTVDLDAFGYRMRGSITQVSFQE